MYNSQEIATRIKETAKKRGVVIKNMLSDLEINVNTISMLAKGREISYMNFAKIADYLNCSVDYLLGKTDEPTETIIKSGDITGNNNSGNTGNVNVQTISEKSNSDDEQLFEMIKSLNLVERSKIIVMIDDMRKGA